MKSLKETNGITDSNLYKALTNLHEFLKACHLASYHKDGENLDSERAVMQIFIQSYHQIEEEYRHAIPISLNSLYYQLRDIVKQQSTYEKKALIQRIKACLKEKASLEMLSIKDSSQALKANSQTPSANKDSNAPLTECGFLQWLGQLDRKQRIRLIKQYKNKLATILKTPSEWMHLFILLDDVDKIGLLNELKDILPNHLTELNYYLVIFSYVAKENQAQCYFALKPLISKSLNRYDTILTIINKCSLEQGDIILEDIISTFLQSNDFQPAYSLGCLFKDIPAHYQQRVFELAYQKLLPWLKRPHDFYSITKHLTSEQAASVYALIKDNLSEFFTIGEDLYSFLSEESPLPQSIKDEVYQYFFTNLDALITEACELSEVLWCLNEVQKKDVMAKLDKKIKEQLIGDGVNFKLILIHLDKHDKKRYLDYFKPQFVSLADDTESLGAILNILDDDEVINTYHDIINAKPELMQTSKDFDNLCEHLEERIPLIYRHLISWLLPRINEPGDIRHVLFWVKPIEAKDFANRLDFHTLQQINSVKTLKQAFSLIDWQTWQAFLPRYLFAIHHFKATGMLCWRKHFPLSHQDIMHFTQDNFKWQDDRGFIMEDFIDGLDLTSAGFSDVDSFKLKNKFRRAANLREIARPLINDDIEMTRLERLPLIR